MGHRDPFYLERDLQRIRTTHQSHLFPSLEETPDLRRGDTRLAAEVALAILLGTFVPSDQITPFEAARLKAYETLKVLAKG